MDAGGPVHDGETTGGSGCMVLRLAKRQSRLQGSWFKETARFRVCPREGIYGIQVPKGAWHSVVAHEPSTIFEAKDGAYGK